jgi:hypothetical protein
VKIAKPLFMLGLLFAALLASGWDQPVIRVSSDSVGPRTLENETASSVVRGYMQAWQSMGDALRENRADLLDASFVGAAKDKLAETIAAQRKLGLKTSYQDRAHDISLVFYSPEGLSIQLLDTVEYNVQVLDQDQVKANQHVRARYVAVLTPTEVRWKVRILQAERE